MASLTAVELGADMCALARTNVRDGEVQLLAAETLDPAAFPGIDAFTAAVRRARKTLKLPRRCRAVVWGLPDGTTRKNPALKPLIAPLIGAGFSVERVISPCNALAALARFRMPRGDGATCWVAINRTGVAMVVLRPGQQLYSHSFAWDSNVGSCGSQARLLQRYSLVAFLAPEIRRAMNAARDKGTIVDAIVTCGNLPEIRSLTMPLIEELDIEVESLDSLEGLVVKPDATDRLADVAASLRMACAGVIARPTRHRDESKRPALPPVGPVGRIAAAAAVILGLGFLGWSWWPVRSTAPPPPPKAATSGAAAPKRTPAPTKAAPQPTPTKPSPPPSASPSPSTTTKQQSAPTKQVSPQVVAPPKQNVHVVPRSQPPPAPTSSESRKPAPPSGTTPVSTEARSAESKGPELLKDPLPRVTAILISSDRRMATIDEGRMVSVGETIGKRLVVAIDDRSVVLREPSGVQIRVGLGGRLLGIERSER
jgi:outer membrane biosynthesis protein TonB